MVAVLMTTRIRAFVSSSGAGVGAVGAGDDDAGFVSSSMPWKTRWTMA